MLFKSEKLQDILEFPAYSAEIIAMRDSRKSLSLTRTSTLSASTTSSTGTKMVLYQFEIAIDEFTAVSQDAMTLRANVYKKKPEPFSIAASSIKSSAQYTSTSKNLEKNVRSQKADNDSRKIASKTFDVSNYISNDLANIAHSISTNAAVVTSRTQKNSLQARASIIKPKNPFSTAQKVVFKPSTPGILKPVGTVIKKKGSGKQLNTSITQGVKVTKPVSKSFSKSILAVSKDPASITVGTQTSLSTLSKSIKAMAANHTFSPPTSLPDLPTFRVFTGKKKVFIKMWIENAPLVSAGSFYILLELENNDGTRVALAEKVISHAKILNSFLTPSFAPRLEAQYVKPGTITVSLEKHPLDTKCRSMKVFRRQSIPEGNASTSSGTGWLEVFDSTVVNSDSFVFRDVIPTSNVIVYRAISYGENHKPSEKFESAVVLPPKEFESKQSGSLTAVAALSTPGTNSYVTVKVKDIPYDVVAVMVRRYNLTTDSQSQARSRKGSGFIYIGQTPISQQVTVTEIDDDSVVSLFDETAKVGNNYRYVPVGITRMGKEITGSSFALEIPVSPDRAQVSISVTNPVLENNVVTIALSGVFTDFGFSEIRRSLASAQQAGLFSNDLLEDRSKFESLIGFLVERVNSRTGQVESFGTYTAGKFYDSDDVRKQKNISDLSPGIEYTYIITALLSTPEALFPLLKRKEVDIRSLVPFEASIAKFRNPLALNKATLQSTARQLDRSLPSALEPTDPIIAGRTNIQVSKEIRIPVSVTATKAVTVEVNRTFNRVIWSYANPDNIDHFRIYVAAAGGSVLIDTVHCDASSSTFYYRHYNKDSSINFRYEVQPIDLSYKEMAKIYTPTIKAPDLSHALGVGALDNNKVLRL